MAGSLAKKGTSTVTIVSEKRNTLYIVASLGASKYEFHLTGSREFGTSHSTSDYDFFVQDTEEVRNFLTSLGFVVYSSSYEGDPQINVVYRTVDVDVQCVQNVPLKVTVQNILKETGALDYVRGNKVAARRIWQSMYTLAQVCYDDHSPSLRF